jgi:AcrR family transcriptional regulator
MTNKPATLRRDAQQNKQRLLAAAREVFSERGLGAPMDEIARRCGVGNATLYRRFPTREALVDEAYADVAGAIEDLCAESLQAADGISGLTAYLAGLCELVADNRGASEVISAGAPPGGILAAASRRGYQTTRTLLRRAQRQGSVSSAVTATDLMFMMAALLRVVPAAHAQAPAAWRRCLTLFLAGLGVDSIVLPGPVPTKTQLQHTINTLQATRH